MVIPANGCIGSRHGVLLCHGSYNAVKTALSRLAFPRFTKHTKQCNSRFIFIMPPANKVWGYIGITLSVRPSVRPSVHVPC